MVFHALLQFCRCFHNHQIRTKSGIKYVVTAQCPQSRYQFSLHVCAIRHAEFVTQRRLYSRRRLENNIFIGIVKCFLDFIALRNADNRAKLAYQ